MEDSTLPAGGVGWILRLGVAAGAEESALLAQAGLRPELLSRPDARVSRSHSLVLWRAIVRILEDPTLPVRYGQGVRPEALGVLGYLIGHCGTVGELFRTVEQFQRLTLSDAQIAVWRSDDGLSIGQKLHPEEVALCHPPEFVVSSFTAMIRAGLGDSWNPVEVFFQHGPVPWVAAIRKVFRCPVRFDAPYSGITLHPSDEALRLHDRDPHLHTYLRQLTEAYLESMPRRPPWTSAVMRRLAHAEPAERPDLESMGRALGMSGRSLQRRLRSEGRRYCELLEGVRIDHAKQMLAASSSTVTEIADFLGYAGVDTFSRAFRRWTGQSPVSWRKQVVELSPVAKFVSPGAKS